MIKKTFSAALLFIAVFLTIFALGGEGETIASTHDANENDGKKSLAGRYVGYSWQGEVEGVDLNEAEMYIETILTLDDDGAILDMKINTFVLREGYWTMRQSGNATVVVDYSIDPEPAVPGKNYVPGKSMFTICTVDRMSFYTVGVDDSGIVAVGIVDPITRYQFEMKFPEAFDYDRTMAEFPISSEYNIPTIRTSASGFLKPESWEEFSDKTIFTVHTPWSHVVNSYGVLEGIDDNSSVKAFLEGLGVNFDNGRPKPMEVIYGYLGNGGWNGNARAIEQALIGQNAREKTSLVDWSVVQYAGGVNKENQFGIDVKTGATRTVQNSIDGISGATVRISRESTSYQRALVAAGILDEDDVIIGRF